MRLLVCLDQSEFSRSILPAASHLASEIGAAVELLSVVEEYAPQGEPWSGREPRHPARKAVDEAREELALAATSFVGPVEITVVFDASPGDGIVRYARETHPDIIALGMHVDPAVGEPTPGDTVREVACADVGPVLLLHPPGTALLDPFSIPVGIRAFASDGEVIGDVVEVTRARLRIRRPTGVESWIPASMASEISGGRLALNADYSEVERFASTA